MGIFPEPAVNRELVKWGQQKSQFLTSRMVTPKLHTSEWMPYSPPKIRSGYKIQLRIKKL